MAAGCLSCFFTYISVLLLGVCLHDVEVSCCQRVIHKKVGDTVEFSSCLPTEGLTTARWKYKGLIIADNDKVFGEHQFKGRVDLNPTNFSLTVRRLTLKDSGDFSFVSEDEGGQRDTVIFTLKVHEPLTVIIDSNSTWHTLNGACTILLECRATSNINNSDITYTWAVRNQTFEGPRLEYIIRPQDKDTKFTCTISNEVSKTTATKTETCRNSPNFIVHLSTAGVVCVVIVVIVGVTVCVCHRKQRQEAVDSNDLTVYADISDVAIADETMKPCTLYETIDPRIDTVTPGPQTVYDKIQISRMRKASVSPYQEIS